MLGWLVDNLIVVVVVVVGVDMVVEVVDVVESVGIAPRGQLGEWN